MYGVKPDIFKYYPNAGLVTFQLPLRIGQPFSRNWRSSCFRINWWRGELVHFFQYSLQPLLRILNVRTLRWCALHPTLPCVRGPCSKSLLHSLKLECPQAAQITVLRTTIPSSSTSGPVHTQKEMPPMLLRTSDTLSCAAVTLTPKRACALFIFEDGALLWAENSG